MKGRCLLLAMALLVGFGAVSVGTVKANDTTDGDGAIHSQLEPQSLAADSPKGRSRTVAWELARSEWLDRSVAANPRLLAAICEHPGPATLVAKHRHIAAMADADHYLCRRLTRWGTATEALLRNPDADHVIELDPQGIYYALERRPAYARVLAGHVKFHDMVMANPDLGRMVAECIR